MSRSYCATQVRLYDYDRYVTALFAPAERREALFALFAFNIEVAKVRETVSEPMIGQIRLQWWRETVEGIYAGHVREHAVAGALARAIETHDLPRGTFERVIDTRERDLADEPPEDIAALLDYAEGTSSTIMCLALDVLQDRACGSWTIARPGGIAYALTGLVRSLPFHLARRRCYIPRALLDRHGLADSALYAARPDLAPVVRDLVALARAHLDEARTAARGASRTADAALLSLSLSDLMLSRIERRGFDIFDPGIEPGHLTRLIRVFTAAHRRRL